MKRKNKLVNAMITLVSGSILANLLTILLSPLITRIYSAEEFGLYTLIITILSFVGPALCLKYDMAIISAKNKKDTFVLIVVSSIFLLITSIIVSIIYSYLAFFSGDIFEYFKYVIITFVLLILYGFNIIFLAYNNKNALYSLISKVTVRRSIINNGLLLGTGFIGFGVKGMVLSQVFSSLSGIWKQSESIRRDFQIFKTITLEEIKSQIIKNKNFLVFNAPSALISTSLYSSINIFVAFKYSVQELGFYALSYRVLGIPLIIISSNISRVFYEKAVVEKDDTGNFNDVFKFSLKFLTIIAVPLILLVGIVSPYAFPLIFGEGWSATGIYVALLTPMFLIRLISESLLPSFIVADKQNFELRYQIIILVLQFIIYALTTILELEIEIFLVILSCTYFLCHSFLLVMMYRLSKLKGK